MNKVAEIKRAKAVVAKFRKYGLGLDKSTIKQYERLGVWCRDLARDHF